MQLLYVVPLRLVGSVTSAEDLHELGLVVLNLVDFALLLAMKIFPECLILLLIIPFQIILLFFGVIFECHIAGSKPKKSINLNLNSLVKKISGRRTKACFF